MATGTGFAFLIKRLDGEIYDLLAQSVCSICTGIFNAPVTTECGHTFCGGCIRRVLSNKSNSGCPLCKYAVNRRDLEADKTQQLISDVYRLLPDAFKADVENLSNEFNIIRDDISTCKTFDFCSPKNEKKKGKKGRPPNKNDSDKFVPVVRKSDKVYHNKKKEVDDLVSISQIEPEIHPGPNIKNDDKLRKVEKVPPEEKINTWMEIAGENLFNTSNTSIFGEKPAEQPDDGKKSSMIRVDYNKDKSSSSDPYEFVASQKNYPEKKKRGRKPNPVKKVPDFQAIQSFTKESVRRAQMAMEEDKEEEEINFDERALDEILSPHRFADTLKVPAMTASQRFDNLMDESGSEPGCSKDLSPPKLITASQKFDDLVEETRVDDRPTHVLYSPKSDQSLMCTYESEKERRKPICKDPSSDTSDLGVAELFSTPKQKRKKSNEGGAKKKSRLLEILQEVKDDENLICGEPLTMPRTTSNGNLSGVSKSPGWSRVSGLKNDFEKAKRGRPKKLKSLNVSGGEKSLNSSKSNVSVDVDEEWKKLETIKPVDDYIEDLSQVSELVTGFSDQALNEEEEKFKRMVEDMEEELDRSNSDFTLVEGKESSAEIIPETESVDVVKEMEVEKAGSVAHESDEDFAEAIAQVFECPIPVLVTPKAKVEASEEKVKAQVSEAPVANTPAPAVPEASEAPRTTAQVLQTPKLVTPPEAITSTPVVVHAPVIPTASPILLPPVENPEEELKPSNATFPSSSTSGNISRKPRRSTPFKLIGRVQKKKKSSTVYIQLGKLAPLFKAKSTVVKLVIPTNKKKKQRRSTVAIQTILPDVSGVGPSKRDSFAQTSQGEEPETNSIGVQMTQKEPDTHSVGVQMTQVDRSTSFAQTSQSPLLSVGVQMTQRKSVTSAAQTSQPGRSSIGLQVSQVRNASAGIQTTQSPLLSAGMQMTQKKKIAAAAQSSQLYRPSLGLQMSQVAAAPMISPSFPSEVFQSRFEKDSEWEEIENLDQLKSQPEEPKPAENSVLLDQEMENEFNTTWDKTQKKTESQKQKNIQDYFPARQSKRIRRISSGDLESPPVEILPEKFEGRQFLPLNVQKVADDSVRLSETIDLESPTKNTQQQIQDVFKNIESDLALVGKTNEKEEELPKSQGEESDTDIFVSQTPPRLNTSKIEIPLLTPRPQPDPDTENTEVIADSVPSKEIERCMENDDQKFKTPPRRPILKPANLGFPNRESFFRKEDPDENDQNKINNEEKSNQVKTMMEGWRNAGKKRLVIVSSSVHNPENVKKLTEKFNFEFGSAVTRETTHLVVGLHPNENDEELPLLTPKFLFALAYKKWIVTEAWVEACLKAGAVVPEEKYESLDTLGGDSCKRARLSTEPLFKDFEIFMYGQFEKITKEELATVLTACGATVVPHPAKFQQNSTNSTKIRIIIIDKECNDYEVDQIQGLFKKYKTVVLSREFVVTVIECYRLVNFTPFLATLTSEEELTALGYPLFLAKHEEDSEAIFR